MIPVFIILLFFVRRRSRGREKPLEMPAFTGYLGLICSKSDADTTVSAIFAKR